MTNNCFSTNLAFLNQKVKIQQVTFAFAGSSLNKKARGT
jgi:hypothetical protein